MQATVLSEFRHPNSPVYPGIDHGDRKPRYERIGDVSYPPDQEEIALAVAQAEIDRRRL
jgi:hypothetical protein